MTKQNHIEQLIQNLCPNGVEYKTLGELLDYEQPGPYIIRSTEYDDKYPTPVLTAGQSFILGYTDETDGIYKASKENPTLIFDDFTTSYHWVEFDFKVKSSAMKMLRPRKDVDVVFRYVYYAMLGIDYKPEEHTRQWISRYANFEIPFPPISVQKEIVRILDTFANLIDNINAEIKERQRQFELALNTYFEADNKKVKIADIGTITRGRRFVRTDIMEQGTPCIHYGDIYMRYPICVHEALTFLQGEITKKMRYAKNGDVVYVGAGENDEDIGMAIAWLGKEPAAVHDACYILSNHGQDAKYLAYMSHAKNFHQQLKMSVASGKICSIPPDGLGRVIIPLPSLEDQQAIAAKLDTIEAFIANLQEERALRQQQYEYYRAKLISLLK